jgi:phosphatidylserine/phosphatidylglycerophosphate/cardiolipin synthase-like enzyme
VNGAARRAVRVRVLVDAYEAGGRDFAVRVDGPVMDTLAESFACMWDLSAFGRREFRSFCRTGRRLATDAQGQPQLLLSGPDCPTAESRRRLLFDNCAARRGEVEFMLG